MKNVFFYSSTYELDIGWFGVGGLEKEMFNCETSEMVLGVEYVE